MSPQKRMGLLGNKVIEDVTSQNQALLGGRDFNATGLGSPPNGDAVTPGRGAVASGGGPRPASGRCPWEPLRNAESLAAGC